MQIQFRGERGIQGDSGFQLDYLECILAVDTGYYLRWDVAMHHMLTEKLYYIP